MSPIYKGQDRKKIEAFSTTQFENSFKNYYFKQSIEVFDTMRLQKDFRVYIISASPDLFVKGAANTVSLPHTQVRGINVEDKNGILTDRLVFPINYAQGKTEALQKIVNEVLAEAVRRTLKYNAYLTQEEFPVYKTAGDLKSKVYSLKKYDSFQLFETYPDLEFKRAEGFDREWQYIEFQGQSGYIPLNTTRPVGFELLEIRKLDKGISSFQDLLVYEFPREDAKTLTKLPEFTEVEILSPAGNRHYLAHEYSDYGWTEIQTKEGLRGFVKGDSVLSFQEAKTKEENLETNGVYETGYLLIKNNKYEILQNRTEYEHDMKNPKNTKIKKVRYKLKNDTMVKIG